MYGPVFVDWEPDRASYTAPPQLGTYIFLAFTIEYRNNASYDSHGLFVGEALGLSAAKLSLPDDKSIVASAPNNANPRVLAGWYNNVTGVYGSAEIQVVPSTSSDNHLGTITDLNDGNSVTSDGFVLVHWSDKGQDLYVHYADGGGPSAPTCLVSISLEPPDSQLVPSEVGNSNRVVFHTPIENIQRGVY